jgi:hypothetical protein
MSNPTSQFTIEEKLHAATRMPLPRREFVDGLQKRLAEEGRQLGTKKNFIRSEPLEQRFLRLFQRPAVAVVMISLLLMVVIILAVGPERVLAQVQRLLGYVPGVGFVDMEMTRILASPVEIAREGVVLRVETVVAEPGRTVVIFSSHGLPEERSVFSPSPEMTTPKPVLYLPDGSILEAVQQRLYYGGGNIEFGAVPEGVYQVTFEIDRLPMTSPGSAPENWQAVLLLQPVIGAPPAEVFPQPYEPEDAFIEVQGVALRILQVAQSPEETGIKVQFEWENKNWDLSTAQYSVKLRDDIGNIYRTKSFYQQGSGAAMAVPIEVESFEDLIGHTSTLEETYQFPPLSQEAREVVLQLTSLNFMALTSTAFTFDPGPNPEVGQTWELDERLEVEGIPLYLTGARLTEDTQFSQDELLYRIEFTFRTPTDLPQIISSFMFNIDREETRGASVIQQWGYPGVFKASIMFLQIPQGPQEFGFERFRITLQGPWEIRWQIPWTDEPQLQERAMRQEEIKNTRYGVTLSVEQSAFSNKSSIVWVDAKGLTEGSQLLRLLPIDPLQSSIFDWNPFSLVTDRGDVIEQAMGISWQPERELQSDLFRVVFDPIPDHVEKVTFHIPAIELFIPGQVAFDIEIPGEVRFHPEEFVVLDLVIHDRQSETYTRWLSDPWDVDISVEVAGYSLHFTRAQLESDHNTNQVRLNLTSETANRDEKGKYLSTFNISSVTHPDGHRESGIEINEMWRLYGLISDRILNEYQNADQEKTTFMIDFCNLDCNDLLPGNYRIEIDGVTVWIAGSWDLEMHFENQ